MARGKHQARSANRLSQQAQARKAALNAELAAEREALAEVQRQAAGVEALREELRAEMVQREQDTATELEALQAESVVLAKGFGDQQAAEQRVTKAWRRLTQIAVDDLGGGREGLERFMGITGRGGYLIDDQSLSPERAARLQVLRRERKRLEPGVGQGANMPRAVFMRGLLRRRWVAARDAAGIPPDSESTPDGITEEQQVVFDEIEQVARAVLHSHPTSLTADAIHAWHPLCWVFGSEASQTTASGSTTLRALGAVPSPPQPADETADDLSSTWPQPTQALGASVRKRLARGDIEDLTGNWRDRLAAGEALAQMLGQPHGALAAGPRHPRPGRAATLRHLFAMSATGSWSRATDAASGPAPLWGEVAVGLHNAATFWLPAGQTYAFANSDPLDAEDVADLRLPFPQTFLAFAEPLDIEPVRKPDADEKGALTDLDDALALRWSKNPDLDEIHRGVADLAHASLLDIGTVLDCRGGRVEGLLLLGDALGRPEDTFAWCVMVPSGGGGTLGRHVIAASLTATTHRTLVENLVAVAAWADWHAPDQATLLPTGSVEEIVGLVDSPAFRRDADRSGAGGVHVLNVRATGARSGGGDGDTGRQVAPHVRRGHWRRQRFGPGRSQVRRMRIAPVLVNAHRGDPSAQVYVLPAGG